MSTKAKILHWVIPTLLSIILFIAIFFGYGKYNYIGLSNACVIPFIIMASYVALRFVARFGTFDMLSYVGVRLVESFKKEEIRSFDSPYQYSEYRKNKRLKNKFYFWPYLTLAIILFILTIVFDLLSKK